MTLSEAISTLIKAKGLTILSSPMALNILDDYKAFNEFPSSKNILKNLVSEGYLEKIAFFYDNQLPIGNTPYTYMNELHSKLGFRMDGVCYVLNALLEALGYDVICTSETEPKASMENASNIPTKKTVIPSSGDHLEFKGVAINGDATDVAEALVKQGYEFIERDDTGILLNGKFAGIDDCKIVINSSIHTGQSYSIIVFTPRTDSWWNLKKDYGRMKNMLQKKYGRPSKCNELFMSPYQEGDGYELTALSSGNAAYCSYYGSKCGVIMVLISGGGQILITYKDKQNTSEHERAESIAAQNDI